MNSISSPPPATPDELAVVEPVAILPADDAPEVVAAVEAVEAVQAAEAPTAALPGLTPAECAEQLKRLFPALFTGPAKPLKLRIQADIQERAPGVFTKQVLSAFLRRYTGGHGYLVAISKGTQRFDLDGAPAGELSAEHRQVATDELARRRANQQTQREQEREQHVQQARQQAEQHELEAQKRRNRAQLLYDFERTTLTAANFSALKAITVDEMDGYLAKARAEREEARRAALEASPRTAQAAPQSPQSPQSPQRPPQAPGFDRPRRPPRPHGPEGSGPRTRQR